MAFRPRGERRRSNFLAICIEKSEDTGIASADLIRGRADKQKVVVDVGGFEVGTSAADR